MLAIVKTPEEEGKLLIELRGSLAAASLTWALIQADFAVKGRAIPEKITEVNAHERRRYEDRALSMLMACNRDAELFAQRAGAYRAWERFEEFVKTLGLTWLEPDEPGAEDVEIVLDECVKLAINRYGGTLNGTYHGLTRHLALLERTRAVGDE